MKSRQGLLVVLIECSSSMNHEMVLAQPSGVSQRIPRGELVIASVSRFLEDLAREADFGVIVGGYALDQNGQVRKYSRSGEEVLEYLVEPLASITASPLSVKSVSRNSPTGVVSQQIPSHLQLDLRHGAASQAEAFAEAQRILQTLNSAVAFVINICCSESAGASPLQVVEKILGATTPKTQVINVHLGTGTDVAIKYPAQKLALRGLARQLFARSSEVSPALAASLKDLKQVVLKGARSLVVNASMIDLSELFAAVRHEIIKTWPEGELEFASPAGAAPAEVLPENGLQDSADKLISVTDDATPETEDLSKIGDVPQSERTGVNVLFVIRTGVEDPFSEDSGIAVRKLLDVANEAIDSCHELEASLSLVTISKDSDGDLESVNAFPADHSQATAVPASSIRGSATDIVDYSESVSDGAGGLIEIPKKKHVYLRAEPSFPCGISEFVPLINELTRENAASNQIIVLFFAGSPASDDVAAIESMKSECDCTILACVWTIGAHSPVSTPLKDLSALQNADLVALANQCQISVNGETVFAMNVNSGRGLSKLLLELASVTT